MPVYCNYSISEGDGKMAEVGARWMQQRCRPPELMRSHAYVLLDSSEIWQTRQVYKLKHDDFHYRPDLTAAQLKFEKNGRRGPNYSRT